MPRVTLKKYGQIEKLPGEIISDVEFVQPFGFACKIESGYGVTLPDQSSDELILIAIHNKDGKPSVDAGEVVIYNSDTNYVKFKSSEIEIKNNDTLITLKGNEIAIKSSSGIKIDGDVEITGKLTVSDDIESDGDVKAGSISLKNHTHQYITTSMPAGPGNTGAAQ